MKLNSILMLLLLLGLVSCSSGDTKNEEGGDAPDTAMESEDDDFEDDEEEGDGEEVADSGDDEGDDEDLFDDEEVADTGSSSPVEISGDVGQYTVEKGDTLMLIAFKLYGDYGKWRMISDENPNVSPSSLRAGTTINYKKPSTPFEWSPQGDPYLIKNGDTLGTISNDKYGTTKKWRAIYQNNKPMIKDPNLIFAGFTLYYVPDDRGVASEL